MNPDPWRELVRAIRSGRCSEEDALARLAELPFASLGYAHPDHHRLLRCGFAETIFGAGKTIPELLELLAHHRTRSPVVLATRLTEEQQRAARRRFPRGRQNLRARTFRLGEPPAQPFSERPPVVIITAGTSDLGVAGEAEETLRAYGAPVRVIADAGVAGLHRLLAHLPALREASAIIAVAGMEGALPSVIGGLAGTPVIGVPSSIGYGAGSGGQAALLAMLNSCAAGIVVVNIDNGFGAAMAVLRLLQTQARCRPSNWPKPPEKRSPRA